MMKTTMIVGVTHEHQINAKNEEFTRHCSYHHAFLGYHTLRVLLIGSYNKLYYRPVPSLYLVQISSSQVPWFYTVDHVVIYGGFYRFGKPHQVWWCLCSNWIKDLQGYVVWVETICNLVVFVWLNTLIVTVIPTCKIYFYYKGLW